MALKEFGMREPRIELGPPDWQSGIITTILLTLKLFIVRIISLKN